MLIFVLDPISSTTIHSSGTVAATCSGQRSLPLYEDTISEPESSDAESSSDGSDDDESKEDEGSEDDDGTESSHSSNSICGVPDNSIKVWSLLH